MRETCYEDFRLDVSCGWLLIVREGVKNISPPLNVLEGWMLSFLWWGLLWLFVHSYCSTLCECLVLTDHKDRGLVDRDPNPLQGEIGDCDCSVYWRVKWRENVCPSQLGAGRDREDGYLIIYNSVDRPELTNIQPENSWIWCMYFHLL